MSLIKSIIVSKIGMDIKVKALNKIYKSNMIVKMMDNNLPTTDKSRIIFIDKIFSINKRKSIKS